MAMLRFEDHALGRPFHAARVDLRPRAADVALHGHSDFYELMAIVAGRGEHRIHGRGVHELQVGDVVLVRPADQHAMRASPEVGMSLINVAFPVGAWRMFVDLARVDPQRGWEHRQFPHFQLRGSEADAVRAVFEAAVTTFLRTPTMLDLLRFWSDAVELIWPEQLPTASQYRESRPEWLVEAVTAMRREENLAGGVPRLLELSGVSPAHLSRSIRRFYGETPTALVADLRLELAATLLATTVLTVTEVARRCGFSGPAYFTNCFRAAHGVPPSAFRDQARRAFVP